MFACPKTQKDHNLTSISKLYTQEKPLTQLMSNGYDVSSEFFHNNQKKSLELFSNSVFIISENFQQRYVNQLREYFQQRKVQVFCQASKKSLQLDLKKHYFIIVDNGGGKVYLGPEFNSVLMTIIGYPLKGNNRKNIYCQTQAQIFEEYKKYLVIKNHYEIKYKKNLNKQQIQHSKQEFSHKMSTIKNFGKNNLEDKKHIQSNIRLKIITKLNKKIQTIQKSENYDDYQNRISKINKSTLIHQQSSKHSLYFLQSIYNEKYNNLIRDVYCDLKMIGTKNEKILLLRNQYEMVKKLIQILKHLLTIKSYNKQAIQSNNIQYFVVINSEIGLKLIHQMNTDFIKIRSRVKFIVVIMNENSQNNQYDTLLIKKSFTSKIIHSIVTSTEDCLRVIQEIGFHSKLYQKTRPKSNFIQINQLLIDKEFLSIQSSSLQIKKYDKQQKIIKEKIQRTSLKLPISNVLVQSITNEHCKNSKLSLETKQPSIRLSYETTKNSLVQLTQNYQKNIQNKQNYKNEQNNTKLGRRSSFAVSLIDFNFQQINQKLKSQNKVLNDQKQTYLNQNQNSECPLKSNICGFLFVQNNKIINEIKTLIKDKQILISPAKLESFKSSKDYSVIFKSILVDTKNMNILPILLDIPGFYEIYEFYNNKLNISSSNNISSLNNKDNLINSSCRYNIKNKVNQNKNIKIVLIIIVTNKQLQDKIFDEFNIISQSMPQNEVIKCIIKQDLTKQQLKAKSFFIYQQILQYLINQLNQ